MTISEMLNFLTVKKGIKQIEISRKTGVSIATISRSLQGKFTPNYRNGKAIEALYNKVVNEQRP